MYSTFKFIATTIGFIIWFILLLSMYSFAKNNFNLDPPDIYFFIFLFLTGLFGYADFLYKSIKKYKKYRDSLLVPERLGTEAEENVNYVLRWLDTKKYIVLRNVYLKNNNTTQEFDNIVISPFGVFNIETKGYSGTIKINKDMSWTKIYENKEIGIENPIFQLQRHHKILKSILGDVNIIDLIVIGNGSTVIDGSENSTVPVLKHDVLLSFIEKYSYDVLYDVNLLYGKIMDHRVEKQDSIVVEKRPRWVKYSVVGLLLIFFVSLGFGIYKKFGKETFMNKSNIKQQKSKMETNKTETSSTSEFKKVATKTICKGKVKVDVSYRFNKNDLIVKLHIENNADKPISVFHASVTDKFKKGYRANMLMLGSDKEVVANSINDIELVFENVDTSKVPYILNCEFFIMEMYDDKSIKVKI